MKLRVILGFFVPLMLVLAAILLVPASLGQWMGVSWRSWFLFGCAPITALLLLVCLDRGKR